MQRLLRMGCVIAVLAVLTAGLNAAPAGAIDTTRAELRGNELRIEGRDAVPNAPLTADGVNIGNADGGGDYDIRFSPFSSATCVALVSDGATTEQVNLDRCTPTGPPANVAPTADAGADQTVTDADGSGSETVTLDGSASSDAEGPIASFEWTDGAISLGSVASITPDFTVGTHTITLTVTDSDGATATDTVVVTVDPQPSVNQPPTADAGQDINRTDDDGNGLETVVLESFNSTDPDGTIVSYQWSKDGSVIASANGVAISQPVGINVITLTVTDDAGATATDELIVTINAQPAPGNQNPVASAGPDQAVVDVDNSGSESVVLDGAGSSDSDGIIVSYDWSENGVPLGGGVAQGSVVANSVVANSVVANSVVANSVVANSVVAGTFDYLLESNQADPPGIVPNSFGGSAASAGDVNGDGFGDVIIGSEVWVNDGDVVGSATVFLGSANGPVGTNPTNAHALIELDQAGNTVEDVASAGDVNGDGFGDVIVGSATYTSTLPGTQLAVNGAAFVFHGSATGITATSPTQADATILANQLTSGMGEWVDSAGDVNGDGFDDIVVSVPRQGTLFPPAVPPNDRSGNYGAILVFHGSANGITGTGFDDADAVILPYEDTGEPLPPVDAQVGEAAGAGDINNDGFDDIVVGGSELTVYLGGPSGIVAQDVFDANDRIFADPPLGVSSSIGGAGVGFVVNAAGDINNDGFADVVASIPGFDVDSGDVPVGFGAAWVFLGGSNGLNATSVSQANASLFGLNGSEIFGNTVASAGDIDNDGFDDVVISARSFAGSLDHEGVAYIFRGSAQGITAASIAQADTRLEASQSGATRHENRYGLDAQSAGDMNGDGFADVIVGKAFYDNGELNEGAAFIYTGQPYPVNPNIPPVPAAGADQDVYDEDADGVITVSVDGSGSVDPDGSIVSYEWYMATINGGTGELLKATGPTATFDLPLISPIAAFGHLITLVVTDDQGLRRGDTMFVFPRLAPTTFEFAEWATLDAWDTTGNVTLGNAGATFPAPPHVNMKGASILSRTFAPAPDTTGLDISMWIRGDLFGPTDTVAVQASFDGGPFTDYYTITAADVTGNFIFYGGSAFPISISSWPATASSITLRFQSNLSAAADAWLASLSVRSIQAPTGGAANQLPLANAGPDQTVVDNDGSGDETISLDGALSTDPDGVIAAYEWRNGPTILGNQASITTALPVGTHTLTLLVTDNAGGNDVDSVTVQVLAQSDPATLTVDLPVGIHNIMLSVTDDDGALATDTVQIIVQSPAANQPPSANAGQDQTVQVGAGGTQLVQLDGGGSSDVDGTIATWDWLQDGVPIQNFNSPTTSVTLSQGTYTFTLNVTDDDGATGTDDVVVVVEALPDPTNTPPTADAGPDFTLSDPDGDGLASASVDGTASSDAEGPIASYEWRVNGTLAGTGAIQGIPFPVGVNTLELTVRDGDDATGTDTAIVTVTANNPPVAVAGPDQTVADADNSGSEIVSVSAAGSADADGTVDFWAWREGGNVLSTAESADLDLAVGTHTIELTVTDNGGDTATDTLIVTVEDDGPPPSGTDTLYVSSTSGGTVGGVRFQDEDILSFDTSAGVWSMFLDGSDIGLGRAGARDIDAFAVQDDGSVLLSIVAGSTLPDVGAVDDSDIVRFVPTSTGPTTAGSFEWYFDGSDVGLTTNAEDVDAVSVLANGDLMISTSGTPSVPGLGGLADEDVLRFTPSSLGATTAGTWSAFFDGSDVALNNSGTEDTHGVWVDGNGDVHLTSRGTVAVSGLSGTGADVFTCTGHSAGTATTCGSHTLFFDGSANGYGSEVMDGLHISRGG